MGVGNNVTGQMEPIGGGYLLFTRAIPLNLQVPTLRLEDPTKGN